MPWGTGSDGGVAASEPARPRDGLPGRADHGEDERESAGRGGEGPHRGGEEDEGRVPEPGEGAAEEEGAEVGEEGRIEAREQAASGQAGEEGGGGGGRAEKGDALDDHVKGPYGHERRPEYRPGEGACQAAGREQAVSAYLNPASDPDLEEAGAGEGGHEVGEDEGAGAEPVVHGWFGCPVEERRDISGTVLPRLSDEGEIGGGAVVLDATGGLVRPGRQPRIGGGCGALVGLAVQIERGNDAFGGDGVDLLGGQADASELAVGQVV